MGAPGAGRRRYPAGWSREPGGFDTIQVQLAVHVNHILINQFRQPWAVDGDRPAELDNPVDERCVETGIPVLVDGVTRQGFRIDTDPHVYGVGVDLDARTAVTAVISRDALPYIEVAFAVRPA
jgi:hypothetical protein